ncbi:lipoyl(octanoyl) transferase LipB [Pelagibacterales bacterium SAG-MED31]|nr:lipoyl(octanoyl) transferase LipB [Pelagibacterales bacterium SAG-MED31]
MNIEIKKQYDLVNYEAAVEFMKLRVNQIHNNSNTELIWFLNHDHIYTQGTSASENEILKKNKIRIVKTNRGGKTTYHGPGQRIVYFMIDLNNKKKDIRKFISIIEQSLIDFLKNYHIESSTFKDRVGIWVTGKNGKIFRKEEKIGAIGLRLKNWVTYHGLSFNIKPQMKNYKFINACGLESFTNTSLQELGIELNEENFDKEYSDIFLKKLKKLK